LEILGNLYAVSYRNLVEFYAAKIKWHHKKELGKLKSMYCFISAIFFGIWIIIFSTIFISIWYLIARYRPSTSKTDFDYCSAVTFLTLGRMALALFYQIFEIMDISNLDFNRAKMVLENKDKQEFGDLIQFMKGEEIRIINKN
jgi:hypothetical protein